MRCRDDKPLELWEPTFKFNCGSFDIQAATFQGSPADYAIIIVPKPNRLAVCANEKDTHKYLEVLRESLNCSAYTTKKDIASVVAKLLCESAGPSKRCLGRYISASKRAHGAAPVEPSPQKRANSAFVTVYYGSNRGAKDALVHSYDRITSINDSLMYADVIDGELHVGRTQVTIPPAEASSLWDQGWAYVRGALNRHIFWANPSKMHHYTYNFP
jgi:hypothetical protein